MILILVISYFLEVRNEEVTNFPFAYELCNIRVSFLCNVILKWVLLAKCSNQTFLCTLYFPFGQGTTKKLIPTSPISDPRSQKSDAASPAFISASQTSDEEQKVNICHCFYKFNNP